MATRKLTAVVIDALEDIKAREIKLINVAKLTSVFDYIAVASAESTRQTKALAKHVMDKVKEYGGWIYGIEGEQSGEWVLVDCGDVVVHIMQPAVRDHYKLEELWGEGKLEFPRPKSPKRKLAAPRASAKTRAGAEARQTTAIKPKATKPKATKPKTGKAKVRTRASTAMANLGKEKKSVARSRVVKKTAVTKAGTTARRKVAATTVKKNVAKKPAANKPVARRRRAAE